MTCGSSSVDRALAFQAEGRGFESRLPLSNGTTKVKTGYRKVGKILVTIIFE